jgi:hypothetical protein
MPAAADAPLRLHGAMLLGEVSRAGIGECPPRAMRRRGSPLQVCG